MPRMIDKTGKGLTEKQKAELAARRLAVKKAKGRVKA